MEAKKATVRLGDQPLAAVDSFSWRLSSGTSPYQTTASVHVSQWSAIEAMLGKPQVLEIVDPRGRVTTVRNVYPLHEIASGGPNLRTFILSDLRWLLSYKLIVRDYNHRRATGDRNAYGDPVPAETQIVVDSYGYKSFTLRDGRERWTARSMVEDVLEQLVPGQWFVDSFPQSGNPRGGGEQQGQLSIQNLSLRDAGDSALARALAYVPGADCYVATDGTLRIFDTTNLDLARQVRAELPVATWAGDRTTIVRKKAIRPKKFVVHYQRQVECLFEFEDDWGEFTRGTRDPNENYMDNVIPTVDVSTNANDYDPELNIWVNKTNLRAGTYLRADVWLEAMGEKVASSPFPWEFDTLRYLWVIGDLEGALGARPDQDSDPDATIARRVAALRSHLRTTFRISRRYMQRIHDLMDVRAAVFDPVTGTRAPAAVWGQCCTLPSTKGQRITSHVNGQVLPGMWVNIDGYPQPGNAFRDTPHSAATVHIVDGDQGVIAIQWLPMLSGTVATIIPSLITSPTNQAQTPVRDLGEQDNRPIVAGAKIEGTTAGLLLAERSRHAVIMSIVPGAPNSRRQMHQEEVPLDDIRELLPKAGDIEEGEGPELHLFVPPSEASARYGWRDDQTARQTVSKLLGLNSDNPDDAGFGIGEELEGFEFVNLESEIKPHARAMAAEAMAYYLDALDGRHVSEVPGALKLRGNMTGAGIAVAAAPSGKVLASHEWGSQVRPIDRFALMPESARHLILGILGPNIPS